MALINNPEGQEKLKKSYENKTTVCCATCYNDCTTEKYKDCYSPTTAFLWWSEELGYCPKLQEDIKYTHWKPVPEKIDIGSFITEKEFSA